jgi:hypothetical protein
MEKEDEKEKEKQTFFFLSLVTPFSSIVCFPSLRFCSTLFPFCILSLLPFCFFQPEA